MNIVVLNAVVVAVVHLFRLIACKQSSIFHQEYKGLTIVPQDIPSETVQIYLDHNNIMNITNSPFIHYTICTKLSLDHNALVEIRGSYWVGLWELKLLFLQFNQIQYIWPSAFSNLPHLEGLYLKSNKLETLPVAMFSPDPHPVELHMTLQRNPLEFDYRLCWFQRGIEDGRIRTVNLDGLVRIILEDDRKTTPARTKPTEVFMSGNTTYYNPTVVTTKADVFVNESVDNSESPMDKAHWIFALIAVIVVSVLVATGMFCCSRFHTVKCELRRNRNRDISIEMSPRGPTSATETDPIDSQGIHLRHRQELYSLSRPSSVPSTQAPQPPSHILPGSPLISPSLHQGEDPLPLQCSSSGTEAACRTVPHVSSSPGLAQRIDSNFYHEIPDNELTNEYSDVAEVWME